jgi:putative Mg2+ transporter-C (MgtC) family protein
MQAHVTEVALVVRVLVGFLFAFLIGFERELRGSVAGTRTFALVGVASTCVAAATLDTPQALAGIITGVGFLGGGVILHNSNAGTPIAGQVTGMTTAATFFATAANGIVVGLGHLLLGLLVTVLMLLMLEVTHLPMLRWLDADRYRRFFTPDQPRHGDQTHL